MDYYNKSNPEDLQDNIIDSTLKDEDDIIDSSSKDENDMYDKAYALAEMPELLEQSYWERESTPPQKNEKPFLTKRTAIIGLAVCMALSSALGFGGGIIARNFGASGSAQSNGTSVIYQSVNNSARGTSASGSLSVADIAALTSDSVVEITTESMTAGIRMQQYISEGAGSGVIVTEDGYIVTNNHVIEGANKITVRVKSGESYSASLAGTDSKTDIALLKISASGLQPAILGDSGTLEVGETAVAIGNPLGELGGTVTDGIISATSREIILDGETMNLLQTNAAINPGNSGGGLFNSSGELIGIVVAKSSGSDVEGLGFAIPINDAKTVIEQLMSNGYVQGRIDLGMSLVDIDSTQAAMMYRVQQLGIYVLKVEEGSNARSAGFQPGDCIVSVGGAAVSSSSDLNKALLEYSVGDIIDIQVVRGGMSTALSLTLSEYTPSV